MLDWLFFTHRICRKAPDKLRSDFKMSDLALQLFSHSFQ